MIRRSYADAGRRGAARRGGGQRSKVTYRGKMLSGAPWRICHELVARSRSAPLRIGDEQQTSEVKN